MNYTRIVISVLIMAGVTYLIRALPMLLCKQQLKNRFVQSFLTYVPYAVLSAMTFPEVLYSTGNLAAGCAGLLTAALLAYRGKGLLPVALGATAAAYAAEQLLHLWGL